MTEVGSLQCPVRTQQLTSAACDAETPDTAAYGDGQEPHVPGQSAAEAQQQAARRQESSRGAARAHDGFGGVSEGRPRRRGRPHAQGRSDGHAARRQGQGVGRGGGATGGGGAAKGLHMVCAQSCLQGQCIRFPPCRSPDEW